MAPSDDSNPAIPAPGSDEFRQIIHELRNCVHSIRIGLALLAKARSDAEKFHQVLDKVSLEQQAAIDLLARLSP